jgi:hypothetical protein
LLTIFTMWGRGEVYFTAAELTQRSAQLILAACLFLAVMFGVLITGWRLTLANSLVAGLLFLLLPVLSAQRLTSALVFYQFSVTRQYRRGVWLRNPLTRYFRVFVTLPVWNRLFLFYVFAVPLVILAEVASGRLLSRYIPPRFMPMLLACLVVIVLGELTVRWLERRRVSAVIRRGKAAGNEVTLRNHLGKCAEALRLPMLPSDSSRLLEHVVGLKLEEGELIHALESVAGSQQHFLSSEPILQAIDRLDVRRRQKALDGIWIGQP